jgi:transposase-like protein
MGTQSSKARTEQRESQWRDRMRRHAASGQSVAEFCRHESVSDASFYLWRARFRACDGDRQQAHSASAMPEAFIDLGPMSDAGKNRSTPRGKELVNENSSGIEVRIDLGHGMVLHIVRR